MRVKIYKMVLAILLVNLLPEGSAWAQEIVQINGGKGSALSRTANGMIIKGTAVVRGTIIDGESQQQLPGASIVATPVNIPTDPIHVVSGEMGQFALNELVSGIYTITVSCVGYAEQKFTNVQVNGDEIKTLEISLAYSGLMSSDNNVSVSRSSEAFFDVASVSRRTESGFNAPASVYFIGTDQVQSRPALTAVDHLQGMPAVDFARHGLQQANVVVRGFNNVFSSAMLSLVDNRISQAPSLRYNAHYFMPITNEDIERIEIVSGPGSALYGPNSANGVMQIFTKSPFGSEGTTVSLGGGGRSLRLGSFRHAASFGNRVGYKISTQYYAGHDWEYRDPAEPDSFRLAEQKVASPGRDFQVQKFSAEARMDFRLAKDFTTIVSGGYSKNSGIDLTGIGASQVKDWAYLYYQGRLYYKNFYAQTFLNRSDAGETFNLRTGDPIVDKSRLLMTQIQHGLALGNWQRFTYGVDILRTRPDTEKTINGRNEEIDDINEKGVFLQSETALGAKTNLVLAGRLDKHNHLEAMTFSPRAALILKPAPNHNLRFSYNRAFNTPATNNLFLDVLSASIPSSLPEPFPRTLLAIRGQGVPSKSGLTFRRDVDGRPLMMSQLAPQAGYIPATVNAIWPRLRQILIDGSSGEIQELLMPTLPEELETAVRGDLRQLNPATGAFDLIGDVADVDPLKPTMTNSFEIGYKGLLANKLLLSVDLYHSRIQDFVGPLKVETPNVFVNPQQLAAALQPAAAAMMAVLISQGMSDDDAQKQAATILADLITAAARLPLGVISPNEVANNTDVILTYRNFGDISVEGVEINLNYYVSPAWVVGANYSFISEDLFRLVDGINNIALNAPKNKMGLSLRYYNAHRGIYAQLRARYIDAFPVESGVYFGEVENYTVLDLNVDGRIYHSSRLALTVQNLLDNKHREIVGAPEIGRLLMLRLSQSF